jgi:glutamyl-tRNA synthetase
LQRFGEVADLATLVRGPVAPVDAAGDREFIASARALLPLIGRDEAARRLDESRRLST